MRILPAGVHPASDTYGFPSIAMEGAKIISLVEYLKAQGTGYEMDAKVSPLSKMDGIARVDCSGFTKWAIYHATAGVVTIPDGSVQQRSWCIAAGFKRSTPEACLALDGAVRIAFLTPQGAEDAGLGAGERHVMLIPGDAFTAESHGGVGPSRRDVRSLRWFSFCEVYVLAPPKL